MSQKITSLHIDKLKGLENLDISFEDKNVTAIFGANGCGKSTILHALACIYKGISQGAETNYFTLKSASNLNGNLNCSKELEHYAS